MFRGAIRHAIAITFILTAFGAQAESTLPPPVNGVTFEEWAAANARLANQQPLPDILKVLNVDEATWTKTNAAFLKALQTGDPASYTFQRYGEVFANPAVGRFKGRNDQPQIKGKLATFEEYARVQADLTAGSEAGIDPQVILKAHDLTVYEFSQEAGRWVQAMAAAAGSDKMENMDRIMHDFEAEYRARYKLPPKE